MYMYKLKARITYSFTFQFLFNGFQNFILKYGFIYLGKICIFHFISEEPDQIYLA